MSPGESDGGRGCLTFMSGAPHHSSGEMLLRVLRLREATVHGTFSRDVRMGHHEQMANPLTIRRIYRTREEGVERQPR